MWLNVTELTQIETYQKLQEIKYSSFLSKIEQVNQRVCKTANDFLKTRDQQYSQDKRIDMGTPLPFYYCTYENMMKTKYQDDSIEKHLKKSIMHVASSSYG